MPYTRLQSIIVREHRAYLSDHIALVLVLAVVSYLVAMFAV